MFNKYFWIMVGALVVIPALIFLLIKVNSSGNGNSINNPEQLACTAEAKLCADGSAVGRTGPKCQFEACPIPTFSWNFTEIKSAAAAPKTGVELMAGTKKYSLGEFTGSCSTIASSSWKLVEGEISGAICYFAGGGDEFGVFLENGNYVLKKGVVEEGSAETPGTRGNFQTLFSLGSQ